MTNTVGILLGTSMGGFLLDHGGGGGALMAFATLTGAGGMALLFLLLGKKGKGVPQIQE